jgi:uncharacterized membrane protein
MNNVITIEKNTADHMENLKNLAVIVYICQILTFAFAGLPLLIGVAINFYKRNDVQGTWLESHFNWQIKTAWMSLGGFALAGMVYMMNYQYSLLVLIPTLILLVYRVVIGWTTIAASQPINHVI